MAIALTVASDRNLLRVESNNYMRGDSCSYLGVESKNTSKIDSAKKSTYFKSKA